VHKVISLWWATRNLLPLVGSSGTGRPPLSEPKAVVLVADDEVLIRVNAADILQEAGYHIFEAKDGSGLSAPLTLWRKARRSTGRRSRAKPPDPGNRPSRKL
jgi:hypothetical protein